MSDLIAAVATPPGTGGVGILRLSGPGAAQAAARVFRPKGTRALPDAPDRQLLYGTLLDQAGQALDTGLAFVSRAPHSYTGEETAELQCHGSPMVLSLVLDALFAAGARQARAGEFTQRAFLNGKLDLTQAEAVIDLIEAETPAAARQAAGQLTGALSRRIDAIYSGLTDVMAHFCAVLDYPDEDLDPFQTQQLQEALQTQEDALTALLRTSRRGRLLSQGLTCVLLGRPNAGKSSLVNKILGEERVIVSNVAGTTRDAVDSYFENEVGKFLFIDTAGMRKKAKVSDQIEKFSVLRAAMAIERSDVCLILIDANEGVTEQDTKVAGMAHESGKACIIVVNKWDAVDKDDKTMDRMRQDIRRDLSYMTYAPIVFISALTGQRVPRLFQLIQYVNDQASMRITTGMLNSLLADATARVQPPTDKGRRLKIYYMTQAGIRPPHFVCFCNDAKLFHFSYQRYLENQIRATFGLEGTPIRLTIRQKEDKEG